MRGDLGTSFAGRDVGSLLSERMQVTLRVVVLATALAIGLGLLIGVVGTVRQYSRLDHAMTFLSCVALSMPVFWLVGLLSTSQCGSTDWGVVKKLTKFYG